MADNRRALAVVVPAPRQPAHLGRTKLYAQELRQAWRQAARTGWRHPRDWWVPEIDGVVDALVGAQDALAACARLGRARAEAGVGLREALDDLCALYRQLPAGGPPPGMVRALAEAWAETSVASATPLASSDEPLSGLTSPAYLRTRLAEVYREAEQASRNVAEEYILLVVDIAAAIDESASSGWEAMLLRLKLGDRLRTVFPGGETLAAAGPATVIGLLARGPRVQSRVEQLHAQLVDQEGLAGTRVWLEGLPRTLPAAHDAVEYLAG